MAKSYNIADVKVGSVIDGLGTVQEIYINKKRVLQFKIDGEYYHEIIVAGTLKLAYNKKEITPRKLERVVNRFTNSNDIKNASYNQLIEAKKLIDAYFEIRFKAETYVKYLGHGLSSVNKEFKFLHDQGFFKRAVDGFIPKNVYLNTALQYSKGQIEGELQAREEKSKILVLVP
jgi:hypothetical protein